MLVRQFLVESLLAVASGGVAGVLLSGASHCAPYSAPTPSRTACQSRSTSHSIGGVLAFTILASVVVAGVLFGWFPALHATRASVVETIKNENADGGPVRRFTVRNTLVVGQVSVSLALLIIPGIVVSQKSSGSRDHQIPGSGRRLRECSG